MDSLRLKWYGTATIILEQNGTSLLFDPFLPLSDKVFQPSIDEFSATDGIFVTHCHFDHTSAIPVVLEQSGNTLKVYGTKKTHDILISKGIDSSRICCITPGDTINIGPFEVRVVKSKHIVFSIGLIMRTLFNTRVLRYWSILIEILTAKENREHDTETVIFEINVYNKRVLLLGSLNLDAETEYATGADLLILPFQGHSDLCSYAMPIVSRLKPAKILLDHYDDTFPPFTTPISTERFISLMRKEHPSIPVICAKASADWIDI